MSPKKLIEKLTAAQVARFPEFREKWMKLGLSTEPAERPLAFAAPGSPPPRAARVLFFHLGAKKMTAKTYTEEELKLVLEQHQKWLREEEGGARANLTDANLTRADLTRANLTRANLTDANLTRANLTRANLTCANLADAGLDGIKEDFLKVLSAAPNEVDGLESALRESRVDGSTYTGECCCLVGTIANVCGRSYSQLPGIKPDASRPAERWFLAINPWLSAKHPIVKTTLDWVAEWKAANPPKILAELVER